MKSEVQEKKRKYNTQYSWYSFFLSTEIYPHFWNIQTDIFLWTEIYPYFWNIQTDIFLWTEIYPELERPFEITELDTAIKNANLKSASGQDGLNTRFIKQNWPVFRVPLFKYAVTCFNKGELSHSFRSAVVRLIPKKGDAR